jgi:hypothetical protein
VHPTRSARACLSICDSLPAVDDQGTSDAGGAGLVTPQTSYSLRVDVAVAQPGRDP